MAKRGMAPEIGMPTSHESRIIHLHFVALFAAIYGCGIGSVLRPIFALSSRAVDLIAGLNDGETKTLAPDTYPQISRMWLEIGPEAMQSMLLHHNV
jgi:hypothetical protein